MIHVSDLADACHAGPQYFALFAGWKLECGITFVVCEYLSVRARGFYKLSSFARIKLHVMHLVADRNIFHGHTVSFFQGRFILRDDLVSRTHGRSCKNVGAHAIFIYDACDEGGAIRIVFYPLDASLYTKHLLLEVDYAVKLFVSAALVAHGDPPGAVAPRTFF